MKPWHSPLLLLHQWHKGTLTYSLPSTLSIATTRPPRSSTSNKAPSHSILCRRNDRTQSSVNPKIASNPLSTQRQNNTTSCIASKDFSCRIQGKIMRCYCPTIVPVECIGDDGENQTDGCPHITCPHCRGTIDNGVKSPDANGVMCRTQGEVVRIVDGAYYFPSHSDSDSFSAFDDGLTERFAMAMLNHVIPRTIWLNHVIPRPIWLNRCQERCRKRDHSNRTFCRFEYQTKRATHCHRQMWIRLYNPVESVESNDNQN